jgi:integrase
MAHYTMARRSELAALTVGDVDLAHATTTISKQVDRNNKKETKKTKTRRTRTIDIEPNLYPLVKKLTIEAGKATTARLLLFRRRKTRPSSSGRTYGPSALGTTASTPKTRRAR